MTFINLVCSHTAQSKLPRTVEGNKAPVVHMKSMWGKRAGVSPSLGKGPTVHRIAFAQGPGCTWWVMQKDGEFWCVPQGDLILGKNSQKMELYDVSC